MAATCSGGGGIYDNIAKNKVALCILTTYQNAMVKELFTKVRTRGTGIQTNVSFFDPNKIYTGPQQKPFIRVNIFLNYNFNKFT